MDQTSLLPQAEDLEANIDELEDALEPLLREKLSQTASTLPLLDKAKLYVLNAYAIESLLFSTLQASGVNAKEHPIFAELGRLKTYFGKIKDVENPPEPKTRLDKGAAARFIKHGLAGNDRYDRERKERMEREKEKVGTLTRFNDNGSAVTTPVAPHKRSHEDAEEANTGDADEDAQDNDLDSEDLELYGGDEDVDSAGPPKKKSRISTSNLNASDSPTTSTPTTPASESKKKGKKDRRKGKKREAELITPERQAPRTQSETFKALLEGPIQKDKPKNKKKGKGKGS